MSEPSITDSEYDSNDYDSDDYDSDYDDESEIYEPGEYSLNRFTIVISELYNDKKHGVPENNSCVKYHYLVHNRMKRLDMNIITHLCNYYNEYNNNLPNEYMSHNIFRNYKNITRRTNNVKVEIAECLYLNGEYCVGILKTFWIKIIQRKWKQIYKERKRVIQERCSLKSFNHIMIYGKWPYSCSYYPSFKGMLSSVSS